MTGPTMTAVVTIGNGGYEMLEVRRVPVPEPDRGELRIRVLAAGVNNTEINTRLGWYSSSITSSTDAAAAHAATPAGASGTEDGDRDEPAAPRDGGWSAPTPFPLIQGTDCCGIVDAVGPEADPAQVGRRVLVRPCMRRDGFESMETVWMGSDFDGAFAEYVTVPAAEAFPVDCDWTDAELGAIPCAYGTAENMLHRAGVSAGDHVLVTGASGGVGSATVQLAHRRGARVTAVTTPAKADAVRDLGADEVLFRGTTPPPDTFDVAVDNVGGAGFGEVLAGLRRGGRYVSSGAIAGPIVELDMRTVHLRDLWIIGCTAWDEPVFPNLIGYIERGELRPALARTFALRDIVAAQQEFLRKEHVGKFVLIP
jgi:NADPH:quinone reductase-like Zn-dependent oxidoreductase